jgi:hypothetical protein
MGESMVSRIPWRAKQVLSVAAATLVLLVLASAMPGSSSPPMSAGESMLVATSGHLSGTGGTNWRTDLEVHNAGSTAASYVVELLKRDTSNTAPARRTYSLGGGQSKRWSDALSTVFSADGAAALRITPQAGSLLVTSRTYNLIGAGNPQGLPVGSTFGQFVPAGAESESFTIGQEARLIQLSQDSSNTNGYRTNIGVVNTSATTIVVALELHSASGALLGNVNETLRPYEYKQYDKIFSRVAPTSVADGYAIVKTTTGGGRFAAYASVVDNRTGDPIYVPAQRWLPGPTTVTLQPGPGANNGSDRGAQSAGMDAWVWKAAPTTNYGSSPVFALNDNQGTGCYNDGSTAYGFVRFDVGGASLPAVATSAKLKLYCLAALQSPAGKLPLELYRLTSDWNEMTVTYNARPTRGPLVTQVNVPDQPAGLGWHELDITALYNQWRSGALPNYGLELRVPTCKANASHDRGFASSDQSEDPARRPTLVVTGTGASPEHEPRANAAAEPIFVPTSAHSTGEAGTNWRTDLEVHNPGAAQASFTVALLKRDSDNSSPASASLTLGPGVAARYNDVVASLFSFGRPAALRVTPTQGTVMVTSRTYNLMVAGNPLGLPVGATFGQFVPGVPRSQAIGSSDHARIIQLAHDPSGTTGFRTNIGFVNAGTVPIAIEVGLYSAAGGWLGAVTESLRAFEYKQIDRIFARVTPAAVGDGFAVLRTTTTGGAFFAYASVIDNRTGDPIFVPAQRVAGAAPPRPTPGPTPTVTPTVGPTPTPPPPPTGGYTSPLDVMNTIMVGLGLAGTNGAPSIESAVKDLQTKGLGGVVNEAVANHPEILSKTSTGLAVNYGSGYTLASGTVLAGTVNVTGSLTATATKVTGSVSATQSGLTKDGAAVRVTSGSATVDLNVASDGTVAGSIVLNASGSGPEGATTVSGTVQIDTKTCPKYPIGGTINRVLGGKTTTITFTRACDGSFTYNGVLERYYLDFSGVAGGSCAINEGIVRIYLAREGNVLTRDPSQSGGMSGLWVASGRIDATNASLQFRRRPYSYAAQYEGAWSGVKQSFPVGWKGTATVNYYQPGITPCSGSLIDPNSWLFLYAIK